MGRVLIGKTLGLNDILYFLCPVGKHWVQLPGEPTPAEMFPNTSWEIDIAMQGRVLIGSGGEYTFGATGGEATHILQESEMTAHNHQTRIGWVEHWNGTWPTLAVNGVAVNTEIQNGQAVVDAGSQTTGAGGGQPFNIMQPYIVGNVWKRTA